jgi:hypothetical protein
VSDGAAFTDFLDALGVRLEAGQRAFCLVAFDGVQVADLRGEDRRWAVKIFGDLPRLEDEEWAFIRMVLCVVAGGRSGKTYLASLRLLHLALTVDLSGLAPGEEAFAIIIAPRLKEAEQALKYIAGAARKHPDIKRCLTVDTSEQVTIRRPQDGQLVTIMPTAAGAGGISGRGKTLVAVLMDETCFFRDRQSGVVNDDAIFDAAEPRVIEGGQTIVASTPWVARGLLHRKHKENWGHPRNAIVAHASTRNMRTNPLQLRKVDNAYKKDAANAAIEFGAEWGSTTTELFFSDAELDSIFDGTAPPLGTLPQPGDLVSAGGDLGFKRNSSSLAILRQRPSRQLWLADLQEHKPTGGQRLKPSVVCGDFARRLETYGASGLVADQHERASLEEHMGDAGLSVHDAPAATDSMVSLRAKARDGLVKAPWPTDDDDSPEASMLRRLRDQLAGIKQRRTVGNQISVAIPEALDGSHGDLAQGLANAVWGFGAVGGSAVEKPDTRAHLDPDEREMIEAEERQASKRLAWL